MRLRTEPVRRALLELAGDEGDTPALRRVWDDDRLAELTTAAAEAHGLASTLHDRLIGLGIEPPDRLAELRTGATARRLAARSSLLRIATALEDADLPWLTCKGVVVAERHERPEHRELNDLDLLVPGSRLGEVLEVAGAIGIESVNRNWAAFVEHGVGEIPLVDGSVWIDLHWDLIGIERVRRGFRIESGAMLARRRRLPIPGGEVAVFDAVDEVLHLALHAGLGGGGRLAWLRDVRVVVAANRPGWTDLVRSAHRTRIATVVGQVLDRARELVGADVPDGVAEALVPRPLLLARRRSDRRPMRSSSLARRVGSGSIVRTGRDGVGTTLRAAADEVGQKLLAVSGRPRRWDVADPDGLLYWATSSGGDAERARYLAMAAAS